MLALAGILTYGGFRVQRGALTLGVVVAFLQYGLRFFRPIQDLSEKYNILQSAMASSERIFKLLDTTRRDRWRRRAPQHVPGDDRTRSSSTTSGSPTRTKTGCCAT